MNETIIISNQESRESFIHFILMRKSNLIMLGIGVFITVFQFIIFKLLYPFPDFFSDSYSYLYAAYARLDINIWPIGYSKFLTAFNEITHSSTALIAFQYFFLELASLYFFFTILYFYCPGKFTVKCLFAFLFINPLFLYISNYVNSDPLFAALSLCWIAQLIWILQRPAFYQVIVQAILVFACFTVRNNAYYYPLISILVFALSKLNLGMKLAGAFAGLLLIVPFVEKTKDAAEEVTGSRQFSLFTGWQLANNALYIRDQIEIDATELKTDEARKLDGISKDFFHMIKSNEEYREYLRAYVGNYFIRQPEAPLKLYFGKYYKFEDADGQVISWGKASAVFSEYGSTIIRHHPIAFFKYFIVPNIKNYFYPPLEKLEIYNLGADQVDAIAQIWFQYPDQHVTSISKTLQGKVLFFFPMLFLFINMFSLGSFMIFIIKRKYKLVNRDIKLFILLLGSFLTLNFFFSVVATINVFRYQFVPMILALCISLLLSEWLERIKAPDKAANHNTDQRKFGLIGH